MIIPKDLIESFEASKRTVFFGGAGVSVASGLPDFRTLNATTSYRTEQLLVPEQLYSTEFRSFFERFMYYPEAVPNLAHRILAKWKIPIVTQNIDGLHQKAGSREVHELHGSIHQSICTTCATTTEQTAFTKCPVCDGFLRPDITLYSETPKVPALQAAIKLLDEADFLIVGGTSLSVSPAMKLVQYAGTDNVLIINKEPTPLDHRARWVQRGDLATVLITLDKIKQ